MAANRLDSSKAPAENGKPATNGNGHAALPDAAAPASGGFKSWLPLLLNLLLMPAVAYAMTTFVLLPKMKAGAAAPAAAAEHGEKPEAKSHEPKKSDGAHGKDGGKDSAKGGATVALPGKVLVNVAGTSGTRYLLANMTLVGKSANLKAAVEKNEAQLRDVASGALASKTIADLEKPGARNLIRSELISVFNNVLGAGSISEIYLTEFAIQ